MNKYMKYFVIPVLVVGASIASVWAALAGTRKYPDATVKTLFPDYAKRLEAVKDAATWYTPAQNIHQAKAEFQNALEDLCDDPKLETATRAHIRSTRNINSLLRSEYLTESELTDELTEFIDNTDLYLELIGDIEGYDEQVSYYRTRINWNKSVAHTALQHGPNSWEVSNVSQSRAEYIASPDVQKQIEKLNELYVQRNNPSPETLLLMEKTKKNQDKFEAALQEYWDNPTFEYYSHLKPIISSK